MKEIGSFIELEFYSGKEYYNDSKYGKDNIIRLNTGRAAIFHAIKCYGVKKVYLPKYECDSVRDFLIHNGIEVKYFNIDINFKPLIDKNEKDSAIVFVNYFGIMSKKYFEFVKYYNNVIIDNAQAFFFEPIDNCYNVYSCRKFIGVPDGSYVIGDGVNKFEYDKDYSSDTSQFLLSRIEYGCEGKSYELRKNNEKRIDVSKVLLMSELSRKILDGADYENNIKKRKENFAFARNLFDAINRIRINEFVDDDSIPMVYPLLIDKDIIQELKNKKMFQGHWWEYLVDETNKEEFENQLSKYIVPITIDQRYCKYDIEKQFNIVKELL